MRHIAVLMSVCVVVGCGDDDDVTTGTDAAAAIDSAAGEPDAPGSDEICGESSSGSSSELDCAAFCAPIAGLECASQLRQSVCTAVCGDMKTECAARFDHFIDCSGPVPEWGCIGPTMLIAGGCTVALDCPCLRPIIEGCSGDVAGIASPGANELDVTATIAECVDILASPPDPDACATAAATAALTVDLATEIGGTSGTAAAFLAFELDDSFTADQVVGVSLQLATGGLGAESDMSGEVWQVAPFTGADLATAVPAKQGDDPVGAGLGAVVPCEVVEWPLSIAVEPSSTVYLGVFPTSPNGADYFAPGADFDPRLRIELSPP